jgi:very-short-patch-repair endonuclease
MAKEKKNYARHLRKSMTLPEVLLWMQLNRDQLGFQFRRQDPFGTYILDFYCPELLVAIEIDGAVHEYKKVRDEIRDTYLMTHGVTVLRFSAKSVLKSPEAVAQQIKTYLEEFASSK